jgi:uracil-DNA glycosylase family 4
VGGTKSQTSEASGLTTRRLVLFIGALMDQPHLDRAILRERIGKCRFCNSGVNEWKAEKRGYESCGVVFEAPRYGTGVAGAKLMIVGQNPPQDPERCLHGGWMFHYPDDKKGPHELLVQRLTRYLGLVPMEVYVTQAVKCPTPGNQRPDVGHINNCSLFLQIEIRDVNPAAILCFGEVAHRAVKQAFGWRQAEAGVGYDVMFVPGLGASGDGMVRRIDNLLQAPHPSVVNRFLAEEAWLKAIQWGYSEAYGKPRPLTNLEWQYAMVRSNAG